MVSPVIVLYRLADKNISLNWPLLRQLAKDVGRPPGLHFAISIRLERVWPVSSRSVMIK
jgi:hypothetical protein